MRYIIKGGVWKNSEDEILKAAVMKYGLNQWSRISSLLVRKSAKQCKQRWYEWLDPSIKKTEWTREEQEKLLHLAKIFPSQWRTIAPIVGRTPMQCVEQYEKLLDLAQEKDLNDPNDPRRLRPGEIDPNPETKPARPDPIDMDEDEKEMLAEARVRLANTKGKKAKRKARGKLIEEARRLALLQKKRELKAAGIQYINHRIEKHHIKLQDRKYKGINYNRELAFERMVPDFVHETGEDEEPEPDKKIANVSLQTLEGQRRDEEEEIRRKIDQRRIKKLKERELDQAVDFQNKYQVKFQPQAKLILPEPQLKDQQLELHGKLNAIYEVSENSTNATRALVSNYSVREQAASIMRTPRAPNTVLREAQNMIALQQTETPLMGGANAPIFSTQVSSQIGSQTPNQLASLLRTPNVLGRQHQESIPQSQSQKQGFLSEVSNQTPIHDAFKINVEEYEKAWEEQSQQVPYQNPQQERQMQMQLKQKAVSQLFSGLKSLPKPKNEFQIDVPQINDNEETKQSEMEMDAEDALKLKRLQKKEDQIKQFKQRSQAYQKNLPTPQTLPEGNFYQTSGQKERDELEQLLSYQIIQLIKEDMYNNSKGLGNISQAKQLLYQEMEQLQQQYSDQKDILEVWDEMRKQCYFDIEEQELVNAKKIEIERFKRILEQQYEIIKRIYDRLNKKQNQNKIKLTTLMKGYEIKNKLIEKEIDKYNSEIEQLEINKQVYQQALAQERNIYKDRVRDLSKYYDQLLVKNNELQSRHADLVNSIQEEQEGYFEQ